MTDKDTPAPVAESIRVSIFDQTYSLRSQSGGEHVERVAKLVDERMRHIASHITTYDISRIAVLAALNIADELETSKAYYEHEIQTLLSQSSAIPEADNKSTTSTESAEPVARETSERQSWFEAIFDADDEAPMRNRGERLSSQVSAKLQSLRQTDSETPASDIDEEDGQG
ncbi:MAG: cell division protein ZapA [Pyrinomonadaceae bacterium]